MGTVYNSHPRCKSAIHAWKEFFTYLITFELIGVFFFKYHWLAVLAVSAVIVFIYTIIVGRELKFGYIIGSPVYKVQIDDSSLSIHYMTILGHKSHTFRIDDLRTEFTIHDLQINLISNDLFPWRVGIKCDNWDIDTFEQLYHDLALSGISITIIY